MTQSDNCRNKSIHKRIQAVFIDDIPNDAMVVDFYETRNERRLFDDYKYNYYYFCFIN